MDVAGLLLLISAYCIDLCVSVLISTTFGVVLSVLGGCLLAVASSTN
jgi:hypothetical protein